MYLYSSYTLVKKVFSFVLSLSKTRKMYKQNFGQNTFKLKWFRPKLYKTPNFVESLLKNDLKTVNVVLPWIEKMFCIGHCTLLNKSSSLQTESTASTNVMPSFELAAAHGPLQRTKQAREKICEMEEQEWLTHAAILNRAWVKSIILKAAISSFPESQVLRHSLIFRIFKMASSFCLKWKKDQWSMLSR